jgi:hypothetical protein
MQQIPSAFAQSRTGAHFLQALDAQGHGPGERGDRRRLDGLHDEVQISCRGWLNTFRV